jgi:hypothetical protein
MPTGMRIQRLMHPHNGASITVRRDRSPQAVVRGPPICHGRRTVDLIFGVRVLRLPTHLGDTTSVTRLEAEYPQQISFRRR